MISTLVYNKCESTKLFLMLRSDIFFCTRDELCNYHRQMLTFERTNNDFRYEVAVKQDKRLCIFMHCVHLIQSMFFIRERGTWNNEILGSTNTLDIKYTKDSEMHSPWVRLNSKPKFLVIK